VSAANELGTKVNREKIKMIKKQAG